MFRERLIRFNKSRFLIFMDTLTKKDFKEISLFRSKFPNSVGVSLSLCSEGGYTVEIKEFPGSVTQAENLADLITMVSDCIATILEVPKEYLPYMPTYLPSVELAQVMNEFPRPKSVNQGKLSIKAGA